MNIPHSSLPFSIAADDIADTVREPLIILDADLRVRRGNRSFYRTFRVSPEDTEGRLIYDLGNRQWDIPALRQLLEEVLPQDNAFDNFEVAHDFETIGRKVMLLNARRLHQKDKNSELILLAIEDITERRRLEEERRELETRFTSLVKNIRDHSIFTLDTQGQITSWNREAEKILGYTEADALGQHFSIIFTAEDQQAGIPALEMHTALQDGRAEDERWHLRKNGERLWALGIVTPTYDAQGRHTGFSKILRDMTERKRLEDERKRFVTMAKLSSEFIGMYDIDGKLSFVNEAGRRLVGLDSLEEALQTPVAEYFFPEDRGMIFNEFFPKVLREGQGEVEVRFRHFKTGKPLWIIFAVFILKDEHGQPVGLATVSRDISERRQIEQALQLRTAELESLLTTAPIGFAFFDRQHRYTRINEELAQINGLPAADHLGRTVAEILPANAVTVDPIIDQVFESGLPVSKMEVEGETPAQPGVRRNWLAGFYPVHGQDGAVALVGAWVVEITDRKRAEEQLRESEGRLRLALTAARMVVWEWTPADGKLRVSENAADVFGLPAGVGLTGIEQGIALLHPDDVATYRATFQKAIDKRDSYLTYYRLVRPNDGRVIWIEERGNTVFDMPGGAARLYGVAADVTERMGSEEEVENSRRMLHALIEQCPFGIYVVDADFRLAIVNAGTVAGAFANVRPLHGRPFNEIMRAIWPEPVATDIIKSFRHTLATGDPYFSKDFVNPRADIEQTEAYEWELHRITLPDGRHGVVCYYFDATKLRYAEQQLKEADRRKDEFLATLAHELRNPLAPIRNAVELLRLLGPPDEKLQQLREMIERNVTHMVRLVDDLLEVSRITTGKITLHKERVNLANVVQNAIETSGQLIEAGQHQLTVTTPPKAVQVEGDVVRLTQVVANLLNNAAKYTPQGGLIEVCIEQQNGEGVVSVRDNGPGIPAAMRSKVFDLFTQIENAELRSKGGLGIGLALVKQLVEMHGGKVDARQASSGGAEFVVRLPLAQQIRNHAEIDATSADKINMTPRRVLVVDDNVDAANSLAQLLSVAGHQVLTAFDGPTAVEQASAFNPEMILLDLGMPGMDGYETAKKLRELSSFNGARMIALTGWGQEEERRRTKAAGFDGHLVKPVAAAALDELLATLQVERSITIKAGS